MQQRGIYDRRINMNSEIKEIQIKIDFTSYGETKVFQDVYSAIKYLKSLPKKGRQEKSERYV